jgi:hypothetical protein
MTAGGYYGGLTRPQIFAAAAPASPRSGSGGGSTGAWKKKDVAEWSNPEVLTFLDTVLPGHPSCKACFGHTTGRVLVTQSKDDLRKQARGDEEAASVIWAELGRYRKAHQERMAFAGNEPCTIVVRTPADLSVEFQVEPTSTVGELKARLADTEGTPVEMQRLTKNGLILLDAKPLAFYSISHGTVLLLVPRVFSSASAGVRGQQRSALPGVKQSGLPRPQVAIVCSDITRPFSISLEFDGIPEYQSFMLGIQRQVGRCGGFASVNDMVKEAAPSLEILPADNTRHPVKTPIMFDAEREALLVDTVGDILTERTRYRAILHLREEQKPVLLTTGARAPGQ